MLKSYAGKWPICLLKQGSCFHYIIRSLGFAIFNFIDTYFILNYFHFRVERGYIRLKQIISYFCLQNPFCGNAKLAADPAIFFLAATIAYGKQKWISHSINVESCRSEAVYNPLINTKSIYSFYRPQILLLLAVAVAILIITESDKSLQPCSQSGRSGHHCSQIDT